MLVALVPLGPSRVGRQAACEVLWGSCHRGHHNGLVLINLELDDVFHLVRLQTVSSFLSKRPCS